jgi:hypothetical protein
MTTFYSHAKIFVWFWKSTIFLQQHIHKYGGRDANLVFIVGLQAEQSHHPIKIISFLPPIPSQKI